MLLVAAVCAAKDATMLQRATKRPEAVFTYASTPEAYKAYGAKSVAWGEAPQRACYWTIT